MKLSETKTIYVITKQSDSGIPLFEKHEVPRDHQLLKTEDKAEFGKLPFAQKYFAELLAGPQKKAKKVVKRRSKPGKLRSNLGRALVEEVAELDAQAPLVDVESLPQLEEVDLVAGVVEAASGVRELYVVDDSALPINTLPENFTIVKHLVPNVGNDLRAYRNLKRKKLKTLDEAKEYCLQRIRERIAKDEDMLVRIASGKFNLRIEETSHPGPPKLIE